MDERLDLAYQRLGRAYRAFHELSEALRRHYEGAPEHPSFARTPEALEANLATQREFYTALRELQELRDRAEKCRSAWIAEVEAIEREAALAGLIGTAP